MKGMLPTVPEILPSQAEVPPARLIQPPPNRFSHELRDRAPFRFDPDAQASGHLEAGTQVLLMVDDGGPELRVADARGLYVLVARKSLKPMAGPTSAPSL